MALPLDATQLSIIADDSIDEISWLFEVDKNGDGTVNYYWSTKVKTWAAQAHTATVIPNSFNGISMRRNQSEWGMTVPSDLIFSISNKGNTLSPADFAGGEVLVKLVVKATAGENLIASWLFQIHSVESNYQKLTFRCKDWLQKYLEGNYPAEGVIESLFVRTDACSPSCAEMLNDLDEGNPLNEGATEAGTSKFTVPVIFGQPMIPIRPIYLDGTNGKRYLIGPAGPSYTLTEIETPTNWSGDKQTFGSGDYNFYTSDHLSAEDGKYYTFARFICSDSDDDGVADANLVFGEGNSYYDIPCKYSRDDTTSITKPADIIEWLLEDWGVPSAKIDAATQATANTATDGWGLTLEGGFWKQECKKNILALILAMSHMELVVRDKIYFKVHSKTSQKVIDKSYVQKKGDKGEGTFSCRANTTPQKSNYGYVTYQVDAECLDHAIKLLIPAKDSFATELITNGDMELDANWVNYSTPTANVRSNTQKHAGSWSRKFTSDAANDGIQGDTFTTETGTAYHINVWVYPDDDTKVGIKIKHGDNSGWLYSAEHTGLSENGWNCISINVTETLGGAGAYIVFVDMSGTTGDWYIDDVTVKLKKEISSATVRCDFIQTAAVAQKIGMLNLQRRLLGIGKISFDGHSKCIKLECDDVIAMSHVDHGGQYTALNDSMTIKKDLTVQISATRFSETLDDFGDLSPAAPTISADSTTGILSTMTTGPDVMDAGGDQIINILKDKLRIGNSTTKYILLEPSPVTITLGAGGDIILTPSDADPSLIKWTSRNINLGSAASIDRGLCFWPDTANQEQLKLGYNPVADAVQRFQNIQLDAQTNVYLKTYHDATHESYIQIYSSATEGYIDFNAKDGATLYIIRFTGIDGAPLFRPHLNNVIDLGTSGNAWRQGWFGDYVIAIGGIHIGGTADPGTANLIVDGSLGVGVTPVVTNKIYAVNTSQVGVFGESRDTDAIASGVYGYAVTNNSQDNRGVFGRAANAGAGNAYHFYSQDGDHCSGGAWNDSSHSSRKELIRDLTSENLESIYALLNNGINIKSYRHKAEIPVLGYDEENTIINEMGEKKPAPIYDNPEKAPERFGLMADDPDLPAFLTSKEREGLSGGRLACYALICIKHQKSLIEQLNERIELLEAA